MVVEKMKIFSWKPDILKKYFITCCLLKCYGVNGKMDKAYTDLRREGEM